MCDIWTRLNSRACSVIDGDERGFRLSIKIFFVTGRNDDSSRSYLIQRDYRKLR